MKKKILYIVLCLIGLFSFNDVRAKVCTDEDIANARATLNVSVGFDNENIYIPTLGRTPRSGKANLYVMQLNGRSSFCLNGAKSATTGLSYKIHHKIDPSNKNWYKTYQFALQHLSTTSENEKLAYFTAQSAFWILANNQLVTKTNLTQIVEEMYLTKNCATLINNFKKGTNINLNANSFCNSNFNSTAGITAIKNMINNILKQQTNNSYQMEYDAIIKNIANLADQYMSFTSVYTGTLYYWESGDHQPMIAPLDCDDSTNPSQKEYYCTDKNGVKHDYTEEYKTCLSQGTESSVCKSQLDNKYCGSSQKKYRVVKTGNSALCSSTSSNYGNYYEYTEESTEGNAIPNIGTSNDDQSFKINAYCSLYCLENSATQIFPGNVRPAVSTGTYIIWPTSDATIASKYKNNYPLRFSGQKTCYVVMSGQDNPTNSTSINSHYSELIKNINDITNQYSKIRKKYNTSYSFDTIRRDSRYSCESIYNENDGACSRVAKQWASYQKTYNDAITARNQCEASKKTCPTVDTCVLSYQGNATDEQKRKECQASVAACNDANKCNSWDDPISTGDRYKSELNACRSEKNLCNSYVNSVNNLIEFGKELQNCTSTKINCSGSSCNWYNYTTNVDLTWGDPEYGENAGTIITDSQLEKSINYSTKLPEVYINTNFDLSTNLSYFNIYNNVGKIVNAVTTANNAGITPYKLTLAQKIVFGVDVTYSLPTNKNNLLYNYVVKRNDSFKAQTAKPSSDSNYTTIGFSNLPISYNASPSTSYQLKLMNIVFGEGKYTPNDYICNYNVTKTLPTDCLCPPGTKYTGKDLSDLMIDQKLTCSEAQEQYCDTDKNACPDESHSSEMIECMETKDYFTCYDTYCRDDDNKTKFCPNDPSINISACLNNSDYDYCVKTLCDSSHGGDDGDGKKYKCKNTNGVDGEMDITSCVQVKMAQGLTESEAISACDALVCPLSGLRIIYRTISLENPFPSKLADADTTNIPVDLKIGMFNDDVRGRYPGTNWNDQKLVQNHILTVKRTSGIVDGSDIYNTEPLYRFELNTTTINKIREYNKQRVENGGYADFTLECRINNAKACVSENFVHNQDLSGIVGGVCMNSTSKNNFYKCSGDA